MDTGGEVIIAAILGFILGAIISGIVTFYATMAYAIGGLGGPHSPG